MKTLINLLNKKSQTHFRSRSVITLLLLLFLTNIYLQAQTPVAANGKLKVVGTNLTNEAGTPIQLRGMSSHGINWFTDQYNFHSLNTLTNEWGIDVFRIAMYVSEQPDQTKGGYEGNPTFWRQYIDDLVDLCGQYGVYAIIDWHILTPGDPTDPAYYQMAKDFWDYMSETHAGKDHVLYEIANEPNGVNWATCKSYAETIIPIIRANDPNTIILIGNPTWSSDVHIASEDPVTGYDNLMYSFHFYAGSHGQDYRDKVTTALNNGVAVFSTEWGTTLASGDGDPIIDATDTWMQFFKDNNISWCNWSYSDKPEGSAALIAYSAADELWNNTSLSGTYVKERLQTADAWSTAGNKPPVCQINRNMYGAYIIAGESATLTADAIDADGTVASVSYYADGSLIGTATTAPYSVNWTTGSASDVTLTAQVTDNGGATNMSTAYTVHVVNSINQTAYPDGTPHQIPTPTGQVIKGIHFDNGGEMIAYHDLDGVHKGPAGSDRAEEGADVEGSSNMGYVVNGEWYEYTVDVAGSGVGNYDFTIKVASGYEITGRIHLEIDGEPVGNAVDVPSSGNWGSYQDVTITDVPIPGGTHVLRLAIDKGGFNFSDMTFTSNSPAPDVTLTAPSSGLSINPGDEVSLSATASSAVEGGSISEVQFYVGSSKVAEDNTAPYTGSWTAQLAGSYSVTAVAVDNVGSTGTSAAATVTVSELPPPTSPNIALNKTASASSTESTDTPASNAVDGSGGSRWSSEFSDPQWLQIDLGSSATISRVIISWEAAFATKYQIQISNDANNWTTVADIPAANGGNDDITFPSVNARYIRMYGTQRETAYGYSIYEFEVYGAEGPQVSVTGLSITPNSMLLTDAGATQDLSETVTPADASNKLVSWISSNTDIATVSSSGLVTAVTNGYATITCTTNDGGFTDTCGVTIDIPDVDVTGVEVLPVELTVEIDRTGQLTINVLPANATNKNVTFATSNTAVATVSESGLVTGISLGSAAITVTTEQGGFIAQSDVTVIEAPDNSYSFGILPSNSSVLDAQNAYTRFIDLFFEDCNDGKGRIKWGLAENSWEQPGQSVSEGIAYGMLLAAYYNDQVNFDKLWNYYKAFPDANGLMNWKTSGCSSVLENNAATDAEIDAAMALIVADKTWGNTGTINYKNDAEWIIGQIKQYEVESGSYVLKPGDVFGGSDLTNISYFAPGYFRAFGEYTNDEAFWGNVADKCYDIIDANLSANNAVGGLVSDWCNASGTQAQGKSLDYSYDACRTNWRIATDYIWYGDSRAKTYLNKSNDFIQNFIGGIENVMDGYKQDGSLISGDRYHNSTFVSTFACAGVTLSNQSEINDYYTEIDTTIPTGYFDYSFDLFSRTLLTGLFVNPLGNIVIEPVTGVSVSPSTVNVDIGASAALTAVITPSNATNKSVTWSSSNTNIATVDESGFVTGVAMGDATITVTTVDGNFTSTCDVNVSDIEVPTYTLTATTTGNGSVEFTPTGGVYAEGTEVSITATASTGYQFDSWDGAASGTNATTTVVMDADKSVIANFVEESGNDCDSPETVMLPYEIDGPGEFCIQTSGTINYINSWNTDEIIINGVNITNDYTSSMPPKVDGKYKISYKATIGWAHLEIIGTGGSATEYNLTSTVVGSGTISPANGTYSENTAVELTATPAAGWQFDEWSGDASGTSATLSLTMSSDKSVTATFSEIPAPEEYTLTVQTIGSGSVTPAGGTYTENSIVELTATPAAGWQFDGWSGDASGTSVTTSVTMTSDKSITATFSEIPEPVYYTLTVETSGNGSVTPGSGEYLEGTEVTLTATADAGNKFDSWSGAASGTAATTTVVLDENKSVTATFVIDDNSSCFDDEPMTTALPSMQEEYQHIHIIGDGPALGNVTKFTINWDLANNGLWQFSMNTNNNQPGWYVNLLPSVNHTLNSAQPSISISESGFDGLDGDYWAVLDGENFALVDKQGAYSIYFSKSADSPCLKSAPGFLNENALSADILVYPNPASDFITIANLDGVNKIQILNTLGQTIYQKEAGIYEMETISIEHLDKGTYILMTFSSEGVPQTQVFSIK